MLVTGLLHLPRLALAVFAFGVAYAMWRAGIGMMRGRRPAAWAAAAMGATLVLLAIPGLASSHIPTIVTALVDGTVMVLALLALGKLDR